MEEETVTSKDVTVIHVAASTEVSDVKKGGEEASLSMELEPSCAEAPSNEELMAEQKSSKKKKKKMAAQEKMRALEFDNVQLNGKVTEAEEQLNALQAQLASLLSEHKELSGIKEAYESVYIELERSKENTKNRSLQDDIHIMREEELKRLLEAAELSAKDAEDRILSLQDELEGLQERMMEKEKLQESLMSATLELSAREIQVKEMYEELELLTTSERQLKGDLLESEALLFSTRDELQAKNIELDGLLQAANAVSDETRFKLQESEARFEAAVQKNMELESALSRSLALKHELEAELKELSDRYAEREGRSNTIHERNQELEELVQSSRYRIEDSDRRVTELELLLEAQKSRSNDLEQVIANLEEKCRYAETELVKHSDMVSALTTELQSANTRATDELKKLEERNLELEDLIPSLHYRIEESERRASELEFLLETQKSRTKDLEQDIHSLVQNFEQAEAKSRDYADTVSTLKVELDKSYLATSRLERALEAAAEDERQLTEEKGKTEEALHDSLAKLQEAENMLGLLHNELIATQGKLESVENDLKAAGVAEIEIREKLKFAEFQLQQQGRVLEEATGKTAELESINAILMKDAELKFQELMEKFANKDSEARSLYEKLQILEDQIKDYEDQAAEAGFKVAAMTEELNHSCTKLASLESLNEELKQTIVDAESKSTESLLMLNDFQANLSAALAEKDYAVERFENSLKATEDLRQELSSDRQSFQNTIASIMEEKRLLGEANAIAEKELQTSKTELDRQLIEYKESYGTLNAELENLKLQASDNSALQSRVNELEKQLLVNEAQFRKEICSIMEEKQLHDEANRVAQIELQTSRAQLEEQLYEYKKGNDALYTELENLKIQATDNSTLQSRVSDLEEQLLVTEAQFKKELASIMEEKQLHNEANRVAQHELQTLIAQLEEQLYEYKKRNDVLQAELENTKLQAVQYNASQTRVKELEELQLATEAHFKKEVEYIQAAAAAREVELMSMLEQHIQRVRDEDEVIEKVHHFEEILVLPPANIELGDIGANMSTAKERKMKTLGKASKQATGGASSPLNNIKIAVGVGIVSIIAGILAGKK